MHFNPSDKHFDSAIAPQKKSVPIGPSKCFFFTFKTMNGLLLFVLFLSSFFSFGIACIGFGGCLLEYSHGGCVPPVAGYFSHCYGGYCRKNKAKGLRTMALNESHGNGINGEGHGRTDQKQKWEKWKASTGAITHIQYPNGIKKEEMSDDDQFTPMEVSPDVLFLECCQSWSLPPPCLPKCSYTNYTAEMLRSMFLRSDECPIESASIIHFCASQNLDHSLCCRQNGILTTRSGDKCLIFCEQLPKNETRLDWSYVPCFERFSEMKKCFYESALRTIDYLEAEFEQLKNGDELKEDEREKEEKERTEEEAEEEDAESTFAIAKPPIIFMNGRTMKHPPDINDNYTPTDESGKREKKGGGERRKNEREEKGERKEEKGG